MQKRQRFLQTVYHFLKFFFYRSHGKTTLLRHIAKRAFNIPPTIDVLYCEQEVIADDTPAVEVVLKADVKCTELQAECKKLEELTEQGDTTVQNRLQEVITVLMNVELFL